LHETSARRAILGGPDLDQRRPLISSVGLAYQQQRYPRTGQVQIRARVYGEFYHARGVAAELRNRMLGARTPEDSHEGIAWLYGGE